MRSAKLKMVVSAAALVAASGTSMAALTVTPTDVITWGGNGVGRSLAAAQPSGLTWAWNSNRSTALGITSSGRVFWQGQYTQSPPLGTIAAASHRAEFTATNSTDVAVFDGIYDGGTKSGFNLNNVALTVGGVSTTGPRISGDRVAFGMQISGGTPAVETGAGLVNNSTFMVGDYAGGVAIAARQNDAVTLNDASGAAASVLMNTALKSISQQNSEINSSGTMVAWLGVPTAAGSGGGVGQFVSTANAAAAPFGNTAFLATKTVGGAYDIVVQGGQSAPGVAGGRFQNGGNGANGFFAKINRNGQVAFDGKLVTTFPVTTGSDDVAYIYTPGTGKTLVRREGQVAPDASGSPDAGGALYSGSIGTAKSFSNAGFLYTSSLTGGDVSTTAGSANDSGMYISTTSGTTRVFRRNDPVPGMPAGTNYGTVPSGSFAINNDGRIVTGNTMQGPGVIPTVGVQVSGGFPGVPAVVTVPGIMGNEGVILTGPANNLQVIARNGDLIPGGGGLRHNFITNNGSVIMNNNGDVLWSGDTTPYAPGDSMGVVGQLASTSILPAGPTVLWGWSQAYGLVALLHTGQQIEVETGVFKSISQFNVQSADNGDGGNAGLNDNGTLVASVSFTDNTWGYIKLQIPAPGTGALALLGLGALARRRRN